MSKSPKKYALAQAFASIWGISNEKNSKKVCLIASLRWIVRHIKWEKFGKSMPERELAPASEAYQMMKIRKKYAWARACASIWGISNDENSEKVCLSASLRRVVRHIKWGKFRKSMPDRESSPSTSAYHLSIFAWSVCRTWRNTVNFAAEPYLPRKWWQYRQNRRNQGREQIQEYSSTSCSGLSGCLYLPLVSIDGNWRGSGQDRQCWRVRW